MHYLKYIFGTFNMLFNYIKYTIFLHILWENMPLLKIIHYHPSAMISECFMCHTYSYLGTKLIKKWSLCTRFKS